MKVKICGITNVQDALWAINLGADFIGLNFYPPSPRKISARNAREIVSQLPPFAVPVGIFVDETPAMIAKLVRSVPLKAVQLHGAETPEVCRTLKNSGVVVIKSIRLDQPLDPTAWAAYRDAVDFFLLDQGLDNGSPGGTGQTFDWKWAERASELGRPWFLAGGLTTENVAQAIRQILPPMVDVCSGVERLPTRKDYESMKRFIQAARSIR